jgi:hypothetical protein
VCDFVYFSTLYSESNAVAGSMGSIHRDAIIGY